MFLTAAAGRQGGKWNTETEALPRGTGLGIVEYGEGVGRGGGAEEGWEERPDGADANNRWFGSELQCSAGRQASRQARRDIASALLRCS